MAAPVDVHVRGVLDAVSLLHGHSSDAPRAAASRRTRLQLELAPSNNLDEVSYERVLRVVATRLASELLDLEPATRGPAPRHAKLLTQLCDARAAKWVSMRRTSPREFSLRIRRSVDALVREAAVLLRAERCALRVEDAALATVGERWAALVPGYWRDVNAGGTPGPSLVLPELCRLVDASGAATQGSGARGGQTYGVPNNTDVAPVHLISESEEDPEWNAVELAPPETAHGAWRALGVLVVVLLLLTSTFGPTIVGMKRFAEY